MKRKEKKEIKRKNKKKFFWKVRVQDEERLGKKRGGSAFEGGLIPQGTIWVLVTYFHFT